MSRVFDALTQAEEMRTAELRAEVTRIVEGSDSVNFSPQACSKSASAADAFESVAEDSVEQAGGEGSSFLTKNPSEQRISGVASITEYAPPAPSDESRRTLQASLASAIEALVCAECRHVGEHEIRRHMRELWSKESIKFASQLEQEFNQSLARASARQDMISEQLAKKFCDALHEQLTVAVSALTSWVERKREELDLEFQKSFSRFSERASEISAQNLANQQRESKALSADLSSRLERAARALEEAGLLSPAAD